MINQLDEQTTLKLLTLDEVRAENDGSALLERINELDKTVLTGRLTFPLDKERAVQLHAHVEPNETDTKIDDELRLGDPKELVLHRKFAKLAIRCFVQLKHAEAKNVLAAFVVEHRVMGISSIVSTPTPTSSNPIAQNVRHVVLIDFGPIDEPAMVLHSALK